MKAPVVYEVPRAQIVAAAERAIAAARKGDADQLWPPVKVSTSLVRRLMRVARTAKEFALGNWWVDDRCGCLVGHLHPEWSAGQSAAGVSHAEYRVGLAFDRFLEDALSSRDRARFKLTSLERDKVVVAV